MKTNPVVRAVGAHLRSGVRLWGDVLSSGAFFGRWTLVASLVMSVTVLGMYIDAGDRGGFVRGLVLSVLVWLVAVVLLAPVALAERRIRRRRTRGVLVVAGVLTVSILRPVLHDLLAAGLFGHWVFTGWAGRMITNAVTWLPVLSIVAAAALGHRAVTVTRARLAAGIEDLARARERLAAYAASNEDLLADLTPRLRTGRDRLLAGSVDFEAVSAYAAEVRTASHAVDDRTRIVLDPDPQDSSPTVREVRDVPLLARLRPPPILLVGAVILAGSAVHLFTLGGAGVLLLAVLTIPTVSVTADLLTRGAMGHAHGRARGVRYLVIWSAAGVVTTVAASVLVPHIGIERYVPLLAFPGVALAAGLGADAVQRATVNIRRLTTVLEADAEELAARTAAARERMRGAADLLHGRLQGRCVVLAAAADEREVTAAERAAFLAATDEALDAVSSGAATASGADVDVAAVLTAWSGVLAIREEVTAAARHALADGRLREDATAALNEALVNVVKHADARQAQVRVDATDGGVRIVVASPGTVRPGAPGRGVATLPGRAALRQDGTDVVLTVELETTTDAAPDEPATRERSDAEVAGEILRRRW